MRIIFALLLGTSLLSVPARGTFEPFRLGHIGVIQYDPSDDPTTVVLMRGHLKADGSTLWRVFFQVDRPPGLADFAMGRTLISTATWGAYRELGLTALDNFEIQEGAVPVVIGDAGFYFVGPAPAQVAGQGRITNLSTRARLSEAGDVVIAGFVVEDDARGVLVRAVGPTLEQFGVPDPASDPRLVIMHGPNVVCENDDWSSAPEAFAVPGIANLVGAFPLPHGSRDAARVVVLPPGLYTVVVTSASFLGNGGTVLVETYSIPADGLLQSVPTVEQLTAASSR